MLQENSKFFLIFHFLTEFIKDIILKNEISDIFSKDKKIFFQNFTQLLYFIEGIIIKKCKNFNEKSLELAKDFIEIIYKFTNNHKILYFYHPFALENFGLDFWKKSEIIKNGAFIFKDGGILVSILNCIFEILKQSFEKEYYYNINPIFRLLEEIATFEDHGKFLKNLSQSQIIYESLFRDLQTSLDAKNSKIIHVEPNLFIMVKEYSIIFIFKA